LRCCELLSIPSSAAAPATLVLAACLGLASAGCNAILGLDEVGVVAGGGGGGGGGPAAENLLIDGSFEKEGTPAWIAYDGVRSRAADPGAIHGDHVLHLTNAVADGTEAGVRQTVSILGGPGRVPRFTAWASMSTAARSDDVPVSATGTDDVFGYVIGMSARRRASVKPA
jgi:hypothetical protein